MTNTERVALLPCLYDATLEQIERANAAVDANLINGVPRWGSAQGYACALTAIMQSDARPLSMTGEMVRALREARLALEPIARRVFNDNGDHTINTEPLDGDVYSACYYAARTVHDVLAAIQEQNK